MQVSIALLLIIGHISAKIEDDIKDLKKKTHLLSQQIAMSQMFTEERIRNSGNSGIKQKRHTRHGTRPYYSDSFTQVRVASIHNHVDHMRTIGMGEFTAVLNGVEFRTRHNDYELYRPHKNKKFRDAVPIDFPDVPSTVRKQKTVIGQVKEMREWFKAWKEQNSTVRDYTKHFKPCLCYLEGFWMEPSEKKVDESFFSMRHSLNALTWEELHQKSKYFSYTGSKDNDEDVAFLPTTIIDFNGTEPIHAQWNYRIMCHPLKKYLEVDRLRVVDDLSVRMAHTRTIEKHRNSTSARFHLNIDNDSDFTEGYGGYDLLDKLMYEIPGLDNYKANITDEAFGMTAVEYNSNKPLNAGFYHRWFRVKAKGGTVMQQRHRGFSDATVFMAMNTQERVPGVKAENLCSFDENNVRTCKRQYYQRWSYAIPLEIIYLTPLSKWNPYNIRFRKKASSVREGGRNGGTTKKTAFDGIHADTFYMTPARFFDSDDEKRESVMVGVLNATGKVCKVMPTGIRINLPEIPGVGKLRQRYPIMPVYQEGDLVYKELTALKDLVLVQNDMFKKLIDEFGLTKNRNDFGQDLVLSTAFAPPDKKNNIAAHSHTVLITGKQVADLKNGETVKIQTSTASKHTHTLEIAYSKSAKQYYYKTCDKKKTCWDKHASNMAVQDDY